MRIRHTLPTANFALAFLATFTAFYAAQLSTCLAQGIAFTYQGRLNDGASPANGSYDLRFAIYDSSGGPGVVAGPLTNSPVAVSNGLFTVTLDFGPGVFTGGERWLDLGVRTNGGGAFTPLAPRQRIAAAPYALYAGTSSNVVSGSVVTSLNSLKDNVTLAAGSNVVITPSGNTLTIASAGAGGSGIWSVNGNNTYYTAGSVGIGTTSPLLPFQVSRPGPYARPAAGVLDGATAWTYLLADNSLYNSLIWDATRDLRLGTETSIGTGYVELARITGAGALGLGTASPLAKLHLYEAALSVSQRLQTGGGNNSWTKQEFANANGQWDIGTSRGFNNDVFYMDRLGNSSLEFQLSTGGLLGLGIEPLAKLHLYDPTLSVSQRIQTGGGTNSWTKLEFVNANGQWNVGTSRGFNSDQFYIYREGQPVAFAVQPNGDAYVARNASVCTVTIRGGCDIAEPFPIKETAVARGAVMVIDDEHPGRLKLSNQAYDTRVAGVVSGANGVNTGLSLQQEGVWILASRSR